MSYMCVGDSHIHKPRTFVSDCDPASVYNLDFVRSMSYFGISGGRVFNPQHLSAICSAVQCIRPDHLMVMNGCNDWDADDRHFDMDCFVHKLVAFLTHLRNCFHLQTVTLLSYFPRDRTRNSTPEEYFLRLQQANRTLRDLCASYRLRFWKLHVHGFTHREQPLLRRAGVHLTPGGMYKLLRRSVGSFYISDSHITRCWTPV
jgi:hypothetical protein